jgi:hypothetical protein
VLIAIAPLAALAIAALVGGAIYIATSGTPAMPSPRRPRPTPSPAIPDSPTPPSTPGDMPVGFEGWEVVRSMSGDMPDGGLFAVRLLKTTDALTSGIVYGFVIDFRRVDGFVIDFRADAFGVDELTDSTVSRELAIERIALALDEHLGEGAGDAARAWAGEAD